VGTYIPITRPIPVFSLLEKAKLAREISDEKNEIPHKFLGPKFSDGIKERFHVFPH